MSADPITPPPERGRTSRISGSGGGLSSSRKNGSKTRFNRTAAKTRFARDLRVNATVAERKLWARLRDAKLDGLSFRRQHPVGPYVLDFYCAAIRLAVELDGDQHGSDAAIAYDLARTRRLRRRGIRVIRFSNHHLLTDMDDVLEGIRRMIAMPPTRSASLSDLPLSGGGSSLCDL